MKKTRVKNVIRIFWEHTLVYKWTALILAIALIFRTGFELVGPLLFKRFFDTIAQQNTELVPELIDILVLILFVASLTWISARIRDFVSIRLQANVMADLNNTAFSYLIRHSYRFFTNMFAGSLVRRVNRLSRAYETVVDEIDYQLMPLIISVIVTITVIFTRSTLLGWILFGWVLFVLVLGFAIAWWKQKYEERRAALDSEATGVLADSITNSITIKYFSGFRHEKSLYAAVIERLRKIRVFTWALNEGVDAIQGFLMIGIEFAMLYAAVQLWKDGILTIGDFALIQAYLLTLFHRVWMFGRVIRNLYQAFADAQEMVDILETPHEVQDHKRATKLSVPNGEIIFDDVTFSYHKTRTILKDFNLTIKPGEKVALVGPSGAGKSTVTQLLLRFHDIDRGAITIDGTDIARVTQDSLRDAIAFVPQEPVLFHRTLMENIRYGRRDATDEEVIAAAKKAHCHEFIKDLPEEYETYVGERGVKLSGGERQRVAIARAILKDAPILVLDEATSSLDSESESFIQESLADLMEGKTTIVIAHRLSTIMKMDRIIVIDGGQVVTTGTHDELLRGEGIYKKLWEIQAGGFLD